jgi:uncharacterized membrane protein
MILLYAFIILITWLNHDLNAKMSFLAVIQIIKLLHTRIKLKFPSITFSMERQNTVLNTVIGGTIALLSACLSSLAVNLQASALKQERIINNLSEQDQLISDADWSEALGADENASEDSALSAIRTMSIWNLLRLACQRSTSVNGQIGKQVRKVLWYRTQWYFGFTLYVICQLFGSVTALGFISPVILAPLGSSGLIFNIIFSSVFSGTRITMYDWLGTILIVIGCAVVSTFGSSVPDPSMKYLIQYNLFQV